MMRSKLSRIAIIAGIVGVVVFGCFLASTNAQRRRPAKHASICFDPSVPCETSVPFEPYVLSFRVPKDSVIYDTELFYAVILKRVHVAAENCDKFISEEDRLSAQALFPHRKVFTSRRCADAGEVGYSNVNDTDATDDHGRPSEFMAVYARATLAEANRMLAAVKATGKFPGANIRRMRTGFNGT